MVLASVLGGDFAPKAYPHLPEHDETTIRRRRRNYLLLLRSLPVTQKLRAQKRSPPFAAFNSCLSCLRPPSPALAYLRYLSQSLHPGGTVGTETSHEEASLHLTCHKEGRPFRYLYWKPLDTSCPYVRLPLCYFLQRRKPIKVSFPGKA